MTRLADAAGHARFHATRLGEPEPLRWLTVAGGRYRVEDECSRCGRHGPITTNDFLCGECAMGGEPTMEVEMS